MFRQNHLPQWIKLAKQPSPVRFRGGGGELEHGLPTWPPNQRNNNEDDDKRW